MHPCIRPIAMAVAVGLAGCSDEVVPLTTFPQFCEAVGTPPDPQAMSSKARYFAPDSIRRSFVQWYDSLVVSAAAHSLDDAPLTDPAVRELRRLHLVGAWNDGHELHVANIFWADEPDDMADSFPGVISQYRRLLSLDPRPRLTPTQKCLFGAINAFYSSLSVHGADNQLVSIPTAYYLRSHEQYDSFAAARYHRPPNSIKPE